jgi:hypothetical protein
MGQRRYKTGPWAWIMGVVQFGGEFGTFRLRAATLGRLEAWKTGYEYLHQPSSLPSFQGDKTCPKIEMLPWITDLSQILGNVGQIANLSHSWTSWQLAVGTKLA